MPQVLAHGRIAPDVGNLMIGKGNVIFQPQGDAVFFHLGNIPKLSITPKAEILKHFSSLAGTKLKDATFVITQEMDCVMTLEEATYNNLRLLFSGTADLTNPAAPIVNILTLSQVTGHLKYFASNDVGPRWYADLPNVTFYPSGGFEAISDAVNSMQITGTVNFANGVWGTMTLHPQANTILPENIILPQIDLGGEAAPTHTEAYTVNIGAWIGAVSYTYLWKAGGAAPGGTPANQQTFTPAIADVGKALTCDVIGTNSIGPTTVTTPATPVVV